MNNNEIRQKIANLQGWNEIEWIDGILWGYTPYNPEYLRTLAIVPHYPTDPVSTLALITLAEKLNVGFSLFNIKHFETGLIEYEAVFYDPWGGPACEEYKAMDENKLRAIDLAFIMMIENR